MLFVDPIRLARRQLEIDRKRTARITQLLAHKIERMVASPLAFLRGAAPLFYHLLERHPVLLDGPAGDGWLVGDAHIENFGAYRAGALTLGESKRTRDEERIVFDLNDFDDAVVGPWRFDLLRLTVSLVLGSREMGANGPHALSLCDALVDAYVGTVFHRKKAPTAPSAVTALVDRVRARTRKEMLDARTIVVQGKRRFVRGARYQELPAKLRAKAERSFAKYAKRLSVADHLPIDALEVLDAAFRVAGTGSLGCIRIGVLVRGKGGDDGAWVFDMKEEGTPSPACLVRPPRLEPAERVVVAFRACIAQPPRMMGTTTLRSSSMVVRRLAPQEDKLDLLALRSEDLEPVARHLGALLGAAHRRAAKSTPKKPWTARDRTRLLDSAIALAGIHEATYLAYCDLVRQ